MTHLTQAQLCAHMDGQLTGPSIELVKRHLAACPPCSARLQELEVQEQLLRAIVIDRPGDDFFDQLLDDIAEDLAGKGRGRRSPPRSRPSRPDPTLIEAPAIEGLVRVETTSETGSQPAAPDSSEPAPHGQVDPPGAEPVPISRSGREESAPSVSPPVSEIAPTAPKRFLDRPPDGPNPATTQVLDPVAGPPSRPLSVDATLRIKGHPARGENWSYLIGGILSLAVIVALAYQPDVGLWLRAVGIRLGPWAAGREPPVAVAVATPDGGAPAPSIPTRVEEETAPAGDTLDTTGPRGRSGNLDGRWTPGATARDDSHRAAGARAPELAPSGGTQEEATADSSPRPRPVQPRSPTVSETPGLLCGEIHDQDGRPVGAAQVMMADLGAIILTDRHGRFCFTAPRGDRTLTVLALGFVPLHQMVSVGTGNGDLVIELRSAPLYPMPADSSRDSTR